MKWLSNEPNMLEVIKMSFSGFLIMTSEMMLYAKSFFQMVIVLRRINYKHCEFIMKLILEQHCHNEIKSHSTTNLSPITLLSCVGADTS